MEVWGHSTMASGREAVPGGLLVMAHTHPAIVYKWRGRSCYVWAVSGVVSLMGGQRSYCDKRKGPGALPNVSHFNVQLAAVKAPHHI